MKHARLQGFSKIGGDLICLEMRVLMIFLAILIGFVAVSSGQTNEKAYKFAEFGPMSQAGVKKEINGFIEELAKQATSQGYVINYGNPTAIVARRKQLTNAISFLKLEDVRITFVDGPPEKQIRTQLWIVPPGATPPTP